MTSVITGDIIHSQKVNPSIWLDKLKAELNTVGPYPKSWEIYRGDSFQIEIPNPLKALEFAVKIKASIKSIKPIDVRMAIGIGEKSYDALKITESNGSAFVYSGELFEKITKEKVNLAIASASKQFDDEINLLLKLALIAMDNWSVNSAEMVWLAFNNPKRSQKELGEMLGIKQNAVSNRLKRANYSEITELIKMYQFKITELIK